MTPRPIKVLLIGANASEVAELRLKLDGAKRAAFSLQSAESLSQALQTLDSHRFEAILLDLSAPKVAWAATLAGVQFKAAETPILAISGVDDEALALEIVRAGAQDYLVRERLTPASLERILLYCIERQRAQTGAALHSSVSHVLAAARSVLETETEILRVLCAFLSFDYGEFWRLDRPSNRLVHHQSWHLPSHDFADLTAAAHSMQFSMGQGLAGRVWASGAPIWIEKIEDDAALRSAKVLVDGGFHSAFALPVTLGSETLGVMEFFGRQPQQPDEELLRVAAIIGIQVGQFLARKLAEEEKQQLTNERLLILDSASEGIYGIDLSGSITFMNQAASRMFQCTQAQVQGKQSHQLFHHTRPDGSRYPYPECPMNRVLQEGRGCRNDREYFWRMDGSQFAAEYSCFPMFEGEKISGAVVCFNDVTERRGLEVELRHSQKLEAVGSLAAGIAHEINTPIQFVGDNTRFLKNAFRDLEQLFAAYDRLYQKASIGTVHPGLLHEVKAEREKADWEYLQVEIPKSLDQALDGINRVANIVRAMKDFSHVDRRAEKAASDLNKAIESTLIVARNELKYVADVDVDFGQIPTVLCHLGDLNQVFLNLLINASHAIGDVVKDSARKGRISVRTRQLDDCVEVAISDTGTGIPEAIRTKVFDPFFTTKEVGKGTGQGLALARAIVVEKHGGTLTFDTEVGKGTTFFVRIPLAGTPEPREAVAI
ncbi:MAG: ATP-binding protein [Candidatus Acidiferrales bacterium]